MYGLRNVVEWTSSCAKEEEEEEEKEVKKEKERPRFRDASRG